MIKYTVHTKEPPIKETTMSRTVQIVSNELDGAGEKMLAECKLDEGSTTVEITMLAEDNLLERQLRAGFVSPLSENPMTKPEDGERYLDALKKEFNSPTLYAQEVE
jgi:hypothetical protein